MQEQKAHEARRATDEKFVQEILEICKELEVQVESKLPMRRTST